MKRKWTNETALEYINRVERGREPMRNEVFECKRLFKESQKN